MAVEWDVAVVRPICDFRGFVHSIKCLSFQLIMAGVSKAGFLPMHGEKTAKLRACPN
jgi:hypothetical protein